MDTFSLCPDCDGVVGATTRQVDAFGEQYGPCNCKAQAVLA